MKLHTVLLTLVVILLALGALAQDAPPKVEISVDYSYARFSPAHAYVPNNYSLNGGGGSIDFNFSRYIGLAAEFEGYNSNTQFFTIPPGSICASGCSGNVQANLFTYLFGPQFGIRTGRIRPFGHVLFGGAHSNLAANLAGLPGFTEARPANNAFALAAGGGLDITLNQRGSVAFRPVEVDYLYTYYNIGGSGGNSNFRYQAGLVFNLGLPPEAPVAAACSVQNPEVMVGEPVHANVVPNNFNPKHPLTYTWASTGGRIDGKDTGATIDTNGVAGGSYSVTAKITDAKSKKNNVASCTASFTVKEPPKNPPQVSCSASPSSVQTGTSATISCTCTSPDKASVTIGGWTASGGTISGSGDSATLNTSGASPGAITIGATCTDSRGLTASASSSVSVENPPPPPPQAAKVNECSYPNAKKPWRVDNTCKAELDDVALKLQQDPDSKLVVVGNADPSETRKNLAAERAVDVKAYLSGGEAKQNIDPSRIETRTGNAGNATSEQWIVPAGATFPNASSTTPVDETQVQPIPDHPKPGAKKKAAKTD